MAVIISVINMKGGVGKTTLTANVGYALAKAHNKKVLLVDIDPQFNASTYLMTENQYLAHISGPKRKGTILDIFVPTRTEAVSSVAGKTKPKKNSSRSLASCTFNVFKSANGSLDLIPSVLDLMEIETAQRRTEDRLHNFLKEKADAYDYILIDCPPTISIFSQAAILASSKYLVPMKPDPLSTIGLPLLEKWLGDYTEMAGTEIDPVGIVFTMVRNTNAMERAMNEIRSARGEAVFENYLTQGTKVAESVESHQPVFVRDPNCRAANEMLAITAEFLEKIQ